MVSPGLQVEGIPPLKITASSSIRSGKLILSCKYQDSCLDDLDSILSRPDALAMLWNDS